MDKENEYKTNLPYGFSEVDGTVQVNESKIAVSEWMFNAASRYLSNVPQAVVEEVQSEYLREKDVVVTMDEAVEKVTFSMIEQYIATELNFRLKDFDPDMKVNELERIQEKLDRELSEDEVKRIGQNYKMNGPEYSEAILRHFIFDNPDAKIYLVEGLVERHSGKESISMSQASPDIKQEVSKEKSR